MENKVSSVIIVIFRCIEKYIKKDNYEIQQEYERPSYIQT